ncbi:TetR/AcrR family transcriptional regulator [Gluconobacter morbifer]|nr:TetR/AcrR family transcriptional regulator [Gluconobacter morbifer]
MEFNLNSSSSTFPEGSLSGGCGRTPQLDERERRTRILDAASSMLATHGYHAASMDSIAACSGMSKKTLYQFFDSKKALFETLILERLFAPINYTPSPDEPLDRQLFGLMSYVARVLFCTERLSLLRSVVSETNRNPAVRQLVADLFHLSGHGLPLQGWLELQNRNGNLHIQDPHEAADLLFGMTLGGPLLASLTFCKPERRGENLDQFIAYGVEVFLKGHRYPPTP